MFKLLTATAISLAASILVSGELSFANENWKVVPSKNVCMVTNMHFGRPQIPVEQDSKTYFGCCENCKATIQNDKTARTALDAYTKKPVDKAKAVIAANETGAVLYFENQKNFEKYKSENGTTSK